MPNVLNYYVIMAKKPGKRGTRKTKKKRKKKKPDISTVSWISKVSLRKVSKREVFIFGIRVSQSPS